MSIKTTGLHDPGPMQPIISGEWVVSYLESGDETREWVVVGDGMVVVAAVVGLDVSEVVVDGIVVAIGEAVVVSWVNVALSIESTISWISFLALSLSSTEGHCQSSPLSSTCTSIICTWPLPNTDPGER